MKHSQSNPARKETETRSRSETSPKGHRITDRSRCEASPNGYWTADPRHRGAKPKRRSNRRFAPPLGQPGGLPDISRGQRPRKLGHDRCSALKGRRITQTTLNQVSTQPFKQSMISLISCELPPPLPGRMPDGPDCPGALPPANIPQPSGLRAGLELSSWLGPSLEVIWKSPKSTQHRRGVRADANRSRCEASLKASLKGCRTADQRHRGGSPEGCWILAGGSAPGNSAAIGVEP